MLEYGPLFPTKRGLHYFIHLYRLAYRAAGMVSYASWLKDLIRNQ